MLHQLPDRAEATWTLQEASQVLGRDRLTLDTEQALSSTVPVQLALFVSGVAATRIMHAEGVEPDVVAGLSVGAFAAAVAAGALAFKDGLSLVKLRAELMEKAYPQGYRLAAVIGLSETHLSQIRASHPFFHRIAAGPHTDRPSVHCISRRSSDRFESDADRLGR
jgi:malonate decarboxylase epsilon subunit